MEPTKLKVITDLLEIIPKNQSPRFSRKKVNPSSPYDIVYTRSSPRNLKGLIFIYDLTFLSTHRLPKKSTHAPQNSWIIPIWVAQSVEDFVDRLSVYLPDPTITKCQTFVSSTTNNYKFNTFFDDTQTYVHTTIDYTDDKLKLSKDKPKITDLYNMIWSI